MQHSRLQHQATSSRGTRSQVPSGKRGEDAGGANVYGSGALEKIVDGTEKPLGQKEPSSTSPSLL